MENKIDGIKALKVLDKLADVIIEFKKETNKETIDFALKQAMELFKLANE